MIAPRVYITRPHIRHAVTPLPQRVPEKTRDAMIREAAYLLAERRGFDPGRELEDWLAAERQIDRWLAERGLPPR